MKKWLLLLAVLLLSGCNVEYELNITEDEFQEAIFIDEGGFDFPITAYYDDEGTSEGFVDGIEYYQATVTDNSSILTYDYLPEDYERSHAANVCFNRFVVNEENGITTLVSSNYYNCIAYYSSLEAITVNVNLDHNIYSIVNHNADAVHGNQYTWYINRNNYEDHYIYMAYQEKSLNACSITCLEGEELINPDREDCYCRVIDETNEDMEEENTIYDYILVGAVLLLFIIAILGIIKYKSINSSGK